MSFHEYDSFPDDSDTPPSPPKLKRTDFNDYGNVLSAMKRYEIDIPSYQQFKIIKPKGLKEEIYNKLLVYWNHGHDNIAGRNKKSKRKKKGIRKRKTRSREIIK